MVKFSPSFLLAAVVATVPEALASRSSAEVANRGAYACTVNSAADANSVSSCSSVVINSFTVSSGSESLYSLVLSAVIHCHLS